MKILIVGGGGREHALIWRIVNNPEGEKHEIYCAPGNGGIAGLARCVDIKATDVAALVDFAASEGIEYTIIGMDDPLALGVVDAFEARGLRVFGPRREAAKLEWSKVYAKNFMRKYGIPTAEYEVFADYEAARGYVAAAEWPLVVKADGLALGKGVYVCKDLAQAEAALAELMVEQKFGASGGRVVIEQCLTGVEVSVMAFCDGETIAPMPAAMDYKRAFDRDEGPNTGGMGAVCPSPFYTPEIAERCRSEIFLPTIAGLKAENVEYKGFLYFGLMLTSRGPYVIEYNARLGDPEIQAILPLLRTDILKVCSACDNKTLDKLKISWDNVKSVVCVVAVSGGYPDGYEVGFPVLGLDSPELGIAFHAGTKMIVGKTDEYVTAGGRVLGVSCLGDSTSEAARRAYDAISRISFRGMRYRSDIGRL